MIMDKIQSTMIHSPDKYPKILVLSRVPFNFNNGTGVALSILFESWPKNRIAQLYAKGHENIPDKTICDNYYQLGAVELPRLFPLNFYDYFKGRSIISAVEPPSDIGSQNSKGATVPNNFKRLKSKIAKILHEYGWLYPTDCFLSEELRVFLDKFSPDLIFSVPAELAFIRLTSQISRYLDIPFAVQVYDNWMATHYGRGLSVVRKRQQLNREFSGLLENASIRFGICELMCRAYSSKYGQTFHSLPVSANVNLWHRPQMKRNKTTLPFRIVYAGSIHKHAAFSGLIDMSKVVEQLNKNGMRVEFLIIGSRDVDMEIKTQLGGRFTKFITFQGQNALIDQVSMADLLFLPVAFDKDSWEFIKYSMPAKSAAYMASGVPMLIYAPKESAISFEARTHGLAYVVDERDIKVLEVAVKHMLTNEEERTAVSKAAIEHSRQHYDREIVSTRVHRQLFDVISCHQK